MRRHALAVMLTISIFPCGCTAVQRSAGSVEQAFDRRDSNVQVTGEGVVRRVLRDDNDGTPHQKFILKLESGRTVLVDHNIEIAPRIEGIKEGDTVAFSGEYIYNDQGGLIHWTHHDPAGRHPAGWLKAGGRVYQ